jgi:hypothetical protein
LTELLSNKKQELAERTVALQVRRIIPDGEIEGRIQRYESHLSRQLQQTLRELERIQAGRLGKRMPPLAAGDAIVQERDPEGIPA